MAAHDSAGRWVSVVALAMAVDNTEQGSAIAYEVKEKMRNSVIPEMTCHDDEDEKQCHTGDDMS
jgi:hypothetical protein